MVPDSPMFRRIRGSLIDSGAGRGELPSIDGNGGVTSFGEVRGWCLRGAAAGDQGGSEGK